MGDLRVLEWEKSSLTNMAELAELGVITLIAWTNRWRVDWHDDHAGGGADSLDDAKEKARRFAQVLLRQVHAQLGRVYDPATDRVVLLPDALDTEDSHA